MMRHPADHRPWHVDRLPGRVVSGRVDRNVSLSTEFNKTGNLALALRFSRAMARRPVWRPYLLTDMVRDAIRLMAGNGIEQTHVVGASMGDMIAQIIVAKPSKWAISLASLMSSGDPDLPHADQRLIRAPLWSGFVVSRQHTGRPATKVPVDAVGIRVDHIRAAALPIIPGMADDTGTGLVPILVDAVAEHCARLSDPDRVARSAGRPR